MEPANPLGDTVKSLRLLHAMVVLCAVLLLGYCASAFMSIWRALERTEAGAIRIEIAALVAFGLLAAAALTLGALLIAALRRQQRTVGELRAHEEELRAQGALLQSALENMGEGLSVFDRDGRLIAWNSRFFELLDLAPPPGPTSLQDILLDQARRGDFGPVDAVSDVRQRVANFYRNIPRAREWVSPHGRTLLIRRRAMPDGAVVTLYSDITEQKESEAKMAEARKHAELANRSKSDFLANMSHELRTPLNAIIGFSEVICNELLGPMRDEKYLSYIEDIHSSGLHLLAIINDVLDMSKIEAGKLELATESVSVHQVVAEAVRMVSERARRKSIELVAELWAVDSGIWGDERAIKQILLNLLSNAIKFSDEGARVHVRALLDPVGGLVLEVEDHGIGMTPEELEKALQPFGQAKPVRTKTHSGTGLGLPITKGLIEAHGGQLVIDSVEGRGTRVRVTLPLASAASPDPMAARGTNEGREDRAVA